MTERHQFFWVEVVNNKKVHLTHKSLLSLFRWHCYQEIKCIVTAEICVKNKSSYHKVHISKTSKIPSSTLLFTLLVITKVSSQCSLHCHCCCLYYMLLMYLRWDPEHCDTKKAACRRRPHLDLTTTVVLAAVVAGLVGCVYSWLNFGLFFLGGWHVANIQPVLLHRRTNLTHLMSNTLLSVRS